MHLVGFSTSKTVSVKVFWKVTNGTGSMHIRQLYVIMFNKLKNGLLCYNGKNIDIKNVWQLDIFVKNENQKVSGISVLHYTKPQVVIIHSAELTEEEVSLLGDSVNSFVDGLLNF